MESNQRIESFNCNNLWKRNVKQQRIARFVQDLYYPKKGYTYYKNGSLEVMGTQGIYYVFKQDGILSDCDRKAYLLNDKLQVLKKFDRANTLYTPFLDERNLLIASKENNIAKQQIVYSFEHYKIQNGCLDLIQQFTSDRCSIKKHMDLDENLIEINGHLYNYFEGCFIGKKYDFVFSKNTKLDNLRKICPIELAEALIEEVMDQNLIVGLDQVKASIPLYTIDKTKEEEFLEDITFVLIDHNGYITNNTVFVYNGGSELKKFNLSEFDYDYENIIYNLVQDLDAKTIEKNQQTRENSKLYNQTKKLLKEQNKKN